MFDKFYQNDSGIPFVVDVDTSFALFKIDLLKFIVFIQQFHLSHPDGRIKGDMDRPRAGVGAVGTDESGVFPLFIASCKSFSV